MRDNQLQCRPKITVRQIDFTVTFGAFKIYLQDFACLYFHQFQVVCESLIEVEGIFPNYCQLKV